jgi:hypothetical protein
MFGFCFKTGDITQNPFTEPAKTQKSYNIIPSGRKVCAELSIFYNTFKDRELNAKNPTGFNLSNR